MLGLLLLFALVIGVLILRKFLAERTEEKLRDNPPERRVVKVSLPAGIKDSKIQMQRFWKKMMKVAASDSKGRKAGVGQIDVVYYVSVPAPKAQPVLECLIYTDPDKMDSVKRVIKQVFDAQSDILELQEDPLEEYAKQIRSIEKIEKDPDLIDSGAGGM